MRIFGRVARTLLHLLLALILLFEEWGWEPLSRGFDQLSRLPAWAWVERRIGALPPWAALLTFAIPSALLVPAKFAAVYLFGMGHYAWGVGLLVGVKILGTALLARLFQLTQPVLMQLPWFARLYPVWKGWKDRLMAQVRASGPWQLARRLRRSSHAWWARVRRDL
jgi:hypothetical protein